MNNPRESDVPHFYVFDKIFLKRETAEAYCEQENIPFDFIVKTKWYLDPDNLKTEEPCNN